MKILGITSVNDELLAKQQQDAQWGKKGKGTFSVHRMKAVVCPVSLFLCQIIQNYSLLVQQAAHRPLSLAQGIN